MERAELLGKMQGKDIFDLAPLEVTVRGTKANPTIIRSRDPIRYVGCTGTSMRRTATATATATQQHPLLCSMILLRAQPQTRLLFC